MVKKVLLIASDELGKGDAELGQLLMKNYLYAVYDGGELPDKIIFINKGVLLASSSSPAVKTLKELEEKGVEILCCGTCVDYYNLKDDLTVGEITNIYHIRDMLDRADKVISV